MKPEDLNKISQALEKAAPLIKDIETSRNSKVIVFICHSSISHMTAFRLNKVIRRLGQIENLDLLVESGGGDIDSATKIVKTIRAYCKKLSVIVPFFVKSAASLIALSADEILMCKDGELGPIDPQVRDPESRMWVPAHSIQEAIKFIEETKDPLVKLSLADKIPPLLMGAYRDSQNATKQYLNDIFGHLEGEKKKEAINTFSVRYLSHGYPIDNKLCKEIGLKVIDLNDDLESKICDLHEVFEDVVLHFAEREENHEHDILIIQGDSQRIVVIGDEDVSDQLKQQTGNGKSPNIEPLTA